MMSLNLPPVAQVVGARASRTTHPQALAGFCRGLTNLIGHAFSVDNPFIWQTKSDVIEKIATYGGSELIPHTRSCTRVREMTKAPFSLREMLTVHRSPLCDTSSRPRGPRSARSLQHPPI